VDLYDELREEHYASLEDRKYLALGAARTKALRPDWPGYASKGPAVPWKPATLGKTVIESQDLASLLPYIDWNPFFAVWELRGKYPNRGYPKIFADADVGPEAKRLFDDAQAMLKEIIDGKWLTARGVAGIYPAAAVGDDIHVFDPAADATAPASRGAPVAVFHGLRQQAEKEVADDPYLCLSDFVAPAASGVRDYLGAFAVGIFGGEAQMDAYAADHDDYRKIMLQALADRLAEAFAEQLHANVRRSIWGYAPSEAEVLDEADLLKVKYQGIRPAPGYPSQPDHTEKKTMWALLDAEASTGIKLTESLAMWPPAAVSALVFASPESRYFAVGKVGKDQIADYAGRKGMPQPEVERWLGSILNYEPTA
jgi:5-methyltetrahydrofolate--homocysteine methyltransferase